MRVYFLVSLMLLAAIAKAQVVFDPVIAGNSPGGSIIMTQINIYGTDKLGRAINLSDVRGTPFADSAWRVAWLFDFNDKLFGKFTVKINLYNNNLHYLNKMGEELVADKGQIKRVVFVPKDSTEPLQMFQCGFKGFDKDESSLFDYMQTYNVGEVQLVKRTTKYIDTYDSLVIYKLNRFRKKESYYLYQNGIATQLPRLTRSHIMESIPAESSAEAWLEKQQNKLKTPQEVALFLDYYNSKRGNKIRLVFD
jgi:hypothetical protein